jgi:hypothetical protein
MSVNAHEPPKAEYHCEVCAALGFLGSLIDRYEAALREIADPENDTSEARRVARAALGVEE